MKMSKKILSVILAVLMAFSTFAVTLSASAAEEPVKPEYTENVTEEDIATLFEDVDTLLVNKVLTGSVIESIFKAMPDSIAMLVGSNNATNIEFYTDGTWSRNTRRNGFHRGDFENSKGQTKNMIVYHDHIDTEWSITRPTTELNQERFKNLDKYRDPDGKITDYANPAPSDFNRVEFYLDYKADADGNIPHTMDYDGPGRYDKGKILLDQPEQQATDEVKNDDGTVTPAKPYKPAVEGTFTQFFKENPIVVKNTDDFRDEINNVIATVLSGGIGILTVLGEKLVHHDAVPEQEAVPGHPEYGKIPAKDAYDSGGAPDALYDIFEALDFISDALGVKQTHSAIECLKAKGSNIPLEKGANVKETGVDLWPTTDAEGKPIDSIGIATEYLQNIVNALFDGGLVKNVVGVLQNLVDEENGALIYKAIAQIIDALNRAVDCPMGGNLGVKQNEDGSPRYTGIAKTVKNVVAIFSTIPTIGDGDAKRFDVQGLIGFLIKDVLHMDGTVQIAFDQDLFDESFDDADHDYPYGTASVEFIFKPMAEDLAKVAAAESPADAAKFVVDYLYETVLQNKFNNKQIYRVFDGLVPAIPKEIRTIAKDIIDPKDDVANVPMPLDECLPMAFSAVGEMVDHHVNLEKHEAKEATCLEDGYSTTCYYCPDCKLYFAESEDVEHTPKSEAIPEEEVAKFVIKATGHEFGDVVAAKDPTLNEEGNVEYKPCTKCGKNFAADADKMAADDTAIEDVTVPKLEGTLGDIDNDGKINSKDVLMVKRHIAKFEGEALDEVQFALADVNADGKVDSLDTLLIMQRIAKLIDSFPAEAEPAPVEPAPAPAE